MAKLTHTRILLSCCLLLLSLAGCYTFKDVSIPPEVKTAKVLFIENRARYVNPQLSPRLTEKLRQKIVNQTRLSQINGDNADYEISGFISEYFVSTAGLSNQQAATNRLTVGVKITLLNRLTNKTEEYDIVRNFDFAATQSLTQAEAQLGDEIIRNLSDDIFNRIFSNW